MLYKPLREALAVEWFSSFKILKNKKVVTTERSLGARNLLRRFFLWNSIKSLIQMRQHYVFIYVCPRMELKLESIWNQFASPARPRYGRAGPISCAIRQLLIRSAIALHRDFRSSREPLALFENKVQRASSVPCGLHCKFYNGFWWVSRSPTF